MLRRPAINFLEETAMRYSRFLVVAALLALALAQPNKPVRHRVPDGQFSFAVPSGWTEMPGPLERRGTSFAAGFTSKEDMTSSYLLLQVKREDKISAERHGRLAASAVRIDDLEELVQYIRTEKYKEKPELYHRGTNTFLFVKEYRDGIDTSITVMAKEFCEYGNVLFHFYLRDELERDVTALKGVLESGKFDDGVGLDAPEAPASGPAK